MILSPTSEDEKLLRLHLVGTLISAVFYGLLSSIFLHCLTLLVTNKRNSYSNRMRWILITYIVAMFLSSTVAIVQAFVFITRALFRGVETNSLQILRLNEPVTLPFAIWGADGFMLWRCMILYRNSSQLQRTIVYFILSSSGFASLGCGILFYLAPHLTSISGASPLVIATVAISITAVVNFTLTSLIAGRLWFHQEGMRRVLGPQYGSPYMRLIVTCVESCVLILMVSLSYVVLFALGNKGRFGGSIIPLLLLPHICVISPILIVYHVARGRAVTSARPSQIITPNLAGGGEGNKKSIQFYHSSTESMTRSASTRSRRHSLSDVESVYSRVEV